MKKGKGKKKGIKKGKNGKVEEKGKRLKGEEKGRKTEGNISSNMFKIAL